MTQGPCKGTKGGPNMPYHIKINPALLFSNSIWPKKYHFYIQNYDFRPTLANWVQHNGHKLHIFGPRTPQKVPMEAQHMGQHYMGPIRGVLVQNRGLEGENCFKT